MNSLAIWFRSFFSWVLTVDTPPYPYESWRDLPKEQWPKGYDPITDSIVPAETVVRSIGAELVGTASGELVQPQPLSGPWLAGPNQQSASQLS